jgi:hypothetical protein
LPCRSRRVRSPSAEGSPAWWPSRRSSNASRSAVVPTAPPSPPASHARSAVPAAPSGSPRARQAPGQPGPRHASRAARGAGAGAAVDAPLRAECRHGFVVRRGVVRLAVGRAAGSQLDERRLIGDQAEALEIVEEGCFVRPPAPLAVVVLDAQHDAPAGRAGDPPGVERVDEVAEVEEPGWRRGEPGRRVGRQACRVGPGWAGIARPERDHRRLGAASGPRSLAAPGPGSSGARSGSSSAATARFWACWTRRVAAISFR